VFHALANGGNKVAGEHVEAGTQLGAGTAADADDRVTHGSLALPEAVVPASNVVAINSMR
jgi:hypothetical protein